MRRLILLLSFSLVVSGLWAQSLKLKDKQGNDITGTTVNLACEPGDAYASFKLDVQNISNSAKNVKVKKYEINTLNGVQGLTICWLSCYPPFIYETPDPIMIQPNELVDKFEGDVSYDTDLHGTFAAKFVFFDTDNPNDSSFVTVWYNIGNVSRNESLAKAVKMSNVYPNPVTSAASFVTVDYKLPSGSNIGSIKVNNLLGTTVSVAELNRNEGSAQINVSNFKNGVYFYSLIINNSSVITRKFVVNR